MPVYADLATFKSKVKENNWHFEWFKSGSLHTLMALLQKDSTTTDVRDAIAQIPVAKRTKYADAFTYLEATFPGLNPAPSKPTGAVGPKMLSTTGSTPLRTVGQGATALPRPAQRPALGLNVKPTPIPTEGYYLIDDPQPITPVAIPVGPLRKAEIVRINEAIARLKRAVDAAVDAVAKSTVNGPSTPSRVLYSEFFGTITPQRRARVRDNFLLISALLGGTRGGAVGTLNLVDSRNDQEKFEWFAATYRNSAVGQTSVLVYVGRLFFTGANDYNVSSDATIVTMVHELAHACFGASDVPTVASGLALNAQGMPPRGAAVANDAAEDRVLAAADPDLAIRNADNYGQFAWLALRASEGI